MQSDNEERKPRFAFTLERDIFLLKTLINVNPWQYGEDQWKEAIGLFQTRGFNVTVSSLKGRMKLLREQYAKAILPKTGTEEHKTERSELIREVNHLIDAAQALDEVPLILGSDVDDVYEEIDIETTPVNKTEPLDAKKRLFAEKKAADKSRDMALKKFTDQPPDPNPTRPKRSRLLEEELLLTKQSHDMQMEEKKMALEEMRETRIKEENQRRDELAKGQLDFQNKQLEVQTAQLDQQKMFLTLVNKVLGKD